MSMQRAFHVVDMIQNVKQKLYKQIRKVLFWDFELEIALHNSWKLSNLNQFETQSGGKKNQCLQMFGLNERKWNPTRKLTVIREMYTQSNCHSLYRLQATLEHSNGEYEISKTQ
jgi:hypothetical protein